MIDLCGLALLVGPSERREVTDLLHALASRCSVSVDIWRFFGRIGRLLQCSMSRFAFVETGFKRGMSVMICDLLQDTWECVFDEMIPAVIDTDNTHEMIPCSLIADKVVFEQSL